MSKWNTLGSKGMRGTKGFASRFSLARLLPARCGRWVLVLVVLLSSLSLQAGIFRRYKGHIADTLGVMGGTRVYATPVEVNGSPGTLAAYSFVGQTAAEVSAVLSAQAKLPPASRSSGGFLTYQENNRVQRVLVLPSGNGKAECIVLLFDQALGDAQRTANKPDAWPEGFTSFPGTPRFTAVCANTRTTFVTAEVTGMPEDAVQVAAAILVAGGWSETPAATPTFRLFSERNRLCAIFASRDSQSGQTTLSVIQRNGAN